MEVRRWLRCVQTHLTQKKDSKRLVLTCLDHYGLRGAAREVAAQSWGSQNSRYVSREIILINRMELNLLVS